MGVVESRSGGAGRDAEGVGNLDQGQPEVVVQYEDRPLFRRQPPEPPLELVAIGDLASPVLDLRPVDRQEADVGAPVSLPARFRIAGVDEEAVEPGIEPVRIAETGQLAPGDHQCLLHRILGPVDVSEDSLTDREEPVGAGADQDAEGLPVALLGLLDEIAIHGCLARNAHWGRCSEPTESAPNRAVQSSSVLRWADVATTPRRRSGSLVSRHSTAGLQSAGGEPGGLGSSMRAGY